MAEEKTEIILNLQIKFQALLSGHGWRKLEQRNTVEAPNSNSLSREYIPQISSSHSLSLNFTLIRIKYPQRTQTDQVMQSKLWSPFLLLFSWYTYPAPFSAKYRQGQVGLLLGWLLILPCQKPSDFLSIFTRIFKQREEKSTFWQYFSNLAWLGWKIWSKCLEYMLMSKYL